MLIDKIFRKTKTYLNTDGRGNFSPEDFNLFLHDAIQSRVEEYFPDINRATNRQNRGLISNSLENSPDRLREKMNHYLKESVLTLVDNNTRVLPDDLRYYDDIDNGSTNSYEFCKNRREFNILKGQATSTYPICYQTGRNIRIAPNDNGDMSISYLRTVNYPKWTYAVDGNGNEFFNPSDAGFVDADIHPSEEDEMVRRVLMSFGINLKEADVTNFAMNEENTDFKETNQS